jgi:addiction module HigA family antidote
MKLRLATIPEERRMSMPRNATDHGVPIHPGEFLRRDFLAPMGLSSNALALALRVPVTRITEIVRERRGITADTALRLARYFGTTPDFWMKMQLSYDLALASSQVAVRIQAEVIPAALELKQGSNSSPRKRLREAV